MKRYVPILRGVIMVISCMLCIVSTCEAENPALKRECEAKARQAAELIQTLGPESAFQKITDPHGPFVSRTSHVFCIDGGSGSLLAHKVARFVGSNMHYYTDADGNHPYSGMLQSAKQSASGWSHYMTYGSEPERRKAPGLKHMHFFKVPGKNIVLCCGYWDDA